MKNFANAMMCPAGLAEQWAQPTSDAMKLFKIETTPQIAMFIAQIGHESRSLQQLSESLNYSVDALLAKFGRHRITEAQARQFGRSEAHPADPEALANILYGGEFGRTQLGNTEPDDGYKFRGQGPKQITGRANVRGCRDALRVRLGNAVPDFEQSPHLLCAPQWGMLAAAWFWDSHGLNRFADRGDIVGCTKVINGGTNGLQDRTDRYAHALKVLPA